MGRTSEYIKRRVVAKFKQNKKISEVVRELKEEEDLSISRHAVARVFGKIRTNASLADNYSTGRQPLLQNNHLAFIDQKMQENDELTSIGT